MPVVDAGTHRCKRCGKLFEWEYFEPARSHMSSPFYQVEKMPDPKRLVRMISGPDGLLTYRKNCPHCDYGNEIRGTGRVEAVDE